MGDIVGAVATPLEQEPQQGRGIPEPDPGMLLAQRLSLVTPELDRLRDLAVQVLAQRGQGAGGTDDPPRVTGSRSVYERFAFLAHHPRETFWVVGLGARNHVLLEERVAEGGANLCALLPREVFRPLVAAGAVQAVLVHNHPSGDATPSAEDLELTQRIATAGALVGVGILDHVIVGAGRWTSLLDEGLMEVPR
jgi:DNA repair protein RadC